MPFSTDDSVDHPVSLYAATKKANELMAHTYSHLYGIPTTGCVSSPCMARGASGYGAVQIHESDAGR
jgi:nucleoside-diphosphate-sugar epimerase